MTTTSEAFAMWLLEAVYKVACVVGLSKTIEVTTERHVWVGSRL